MSLIEHRERGWCECLTCSGIVEAEAPPPPESTERAVRPPRTRGDCADGVRPCPWAACRYHLEHGGESCALDVADRGPLTYYQLAPLLGVTRNAIIYVEKVALAKLAKRAGRMRQDVDREVTRNITAPDDGADETEEG